ncbi:precorrin-2 C(20)-methyltransferase [Nocardia brasiliensis]|uniref:precorrin-2 C(20)-methyltransferase n=1 Tax=Nocardia brasiliensis TaxID=37326 RepID=UPI00366DA027
MTDSTAGAEQADGASRPDHGLLPSQHATRGDQQQLAQNGDGETAAAPGKLWGVGLGPGDPELVTVKAARVIAEADVIAFHSARHGRSISRAIAAPYMRAWQLEEHLVYPVTTETTDHPGGYQGAIDEFYEQAAQRLAGHLAAGRSVALLAAGDPLFYSSYMHMHRRLADRFEAEIIPGITSVSAASAALGTPLVEGEQVLTVLPGTMPVDELTRRLRDTEAAAIMKLGRTYPGVRQALSDSGRLDDAYYVERASSTRQRVLRAAEVDDADVPYFSITLVPGPTPTTPLPRAATETGAAQHISAIDQSRADSPPQPHASLPTQSHASTPTQSHASTPTQPPASTLTQSPASTPTQPPASTLTQTHASTPTQPHASTPTQPPANTLTQPPANTLTQPPANTLTQPPANTLTQPPANTPTQPPASTPTQTHASTPTESRANAPAAAGASPVEHRESGTAETSFADDAPLDRAPDRAGRVIVVGLGPGAPEWTTTEVHEALADATDLVGYTTYLDRVPTRPGQRRHASDNRVESERAAMALDLARRGARVVVVSSGDPGVFAMAAAVLEEAADPQWRGVPVRVLPGLTAANAVASRAGAPLGHDYAMISLSDRLKPWEVVAQRLSAVAAADMAIAVYNPASSQRTWQVGAMRDLLLEHRKPDTPVVLGRDVGGPTESVRVVSLGDLDPAEVDMRTLLIIGASTTVAMDTDQGVRVYTSRRYAGTGDAARADA